VLFYTFAKNSKNLLLLCHYEVLCVFREGWNITKCGKSQGVWILSECTIYFGGLLLLPVLHVILAFIHATYQFENNVSKYN
jgi:hypothetical protein